MKKESIPGRPHIVIVGGGFAGVAAARTMTKHEAAGIDVTVIDRTNHHTFQPLLYQVATAGLTPADIAHPIRAIFRNAKNINTLLGEVTAINTESRTIDLGEDQLVYDALIVTAGATHSYFGNDQWADVAPGLKTIEDATEIRRRILLAFENAERAHSEVEAKRQLTFVIIGAGPTGVELAGAIGELARRTIAEDFRRIDPQSTEIFLVEAGPRILPSFSEKMSRRAGKDLERLGVKILISTRVTNIVPGAVTCGDRVIACATAIWAAGVHASPLGAMLGAPIDKAGRVEVNPDMSVPGCANVFVAGDLAAVKLPSGGLVPGVAPAAMQMGRCAGANALKLLHGKPTAEFKYLDKGSLATIGRAAAVAEFGALKFGGFLAWFMWVAIHIYFLIDFRNRVMVLIDWVLAYVTYRRGARLITSPRL